MSVALPSAFSVEIDFVGAATSAKCGRLFSFPAHPLQTERERERLCPELGTAGGGDMGMGVPDCRWPPADMLRGEATGTL